MSRRSDKKKSNIGCSPSLYQYINYYPNLTIEQLNYLNRGPTYVTPCQVHLSINQTNVIDRLLLKQMAPLRRQLTKFFTKYPIDLGLRMKFEQEIGQLFEKFFSTSIPLVIEQRSIYEQQLLRSIQIQLRKDHLILRRTADNNNTYYLGDENEFNQKINEYMENAMYYELVVNIDDDTNSEQQYLNEIIQSIDSILEELHKKKLINKDNLPKMLASKRTNIHLPYLYFLPIVNMVSNS